VIRAALVIGCLGAWVLVPAVSAGEARPAANVSIIDNAFLRGVQRPTVRVRRGQRVVWHWRSQQSHSVRVRSGPRRFETPTRNHGTFSYRFTVAGTYRIECALHAPGMRMTVVVRR
jgi:plastocyanin